MLSEVKRLLKPNLTSLFTNVLVQLYFFSTNTIYLNKTDFDITVTQPIDVI